MWAGMQTKTVVAVNMTFVRIHCRRVNVSAAYATNSNLRDRIVIVMHDSDDACKDWIQVSAAVHPSAAIWRIPYYTYTYFSRT